MGYRSEAAIVKGSVLTIDNHRLLGWFSIENGSVLGFGNSLPNRRSFQVLCAAGRNSTSQRVLNQHRCIKTLLLVPSFSLASSSSFTASGTSTQERVCKMQETT
jgi:hypothetical protein